MPTYEYQCPQCQNRFEKRQSFSEEPGATCPSCGAAANRKISTPAIVFKGSGWYATDHRPTNFADRDPSQGPPEPPTTVPAAATPAAETSPASSSSSSSSSSDAS